MQLRALVAAALLVGSVTPGAASADAAEASRGVAVLDAGSGDVRWTLAAPEGVTFQAGKAGDGVVIATERVCKELEDAGDPAPVLRAFDEASGSRRWSAPGGGVATRSMVWGPMPPVDLGARGVVVVGGARYLPDVRGVTLRDGATRWSAGPESHELGVSDSLVFSAVGDRSSSVLRASSRRTGKEVFSFPGSADPTWTDAFDVVAADTRTVVVANGGYLTRLGSEPSAPTTFFVLDATTGRERSRFESADPRLTFSGFAMGHGLLVYSERGSIVARNLDDGSVVWHRSFRDRQPLITAPTTDVVVVATSGGRLRALDLRTGAGRWSLAHALVRASDDRTALVIGDSGTDRRFSAVDLGSGDTRWSRMLPASIPGDVSQVSFAVSGETVVLSDACDLG